MNILQVNTSARGGQDSLSARLAGELVERLVERQPGATVSVRDLARQAHPALDEAALQALFTAPEQRSAEQAARVALDDALIAQIQAADVLVLASPMFNFGVTTQLKNWIDAIARARVTFQYTATGPQGLLTGKKVFVVVTRGGVHRDQPTDTQVPYLRQVLAFLGMKDVQVVYAEGQGLGPEAAERGIADARAQIDALLPTASAAQAA